MESSLNKRAAKLNIKSDDVCTNRSERRKDLKSKLKVLNITEKPCKRKKNLSLKKTLRQKWILKQRIENVSKTVEEKPKEDLQLETSV